MAVIYDELKLLTTIKTAVAGVSGFASAGGVFVSPLAAAKAMEQGRMPVAVITPGGATADRDEPNMWDVEVGITLMVFNAGDAVGENAVMGGHGYDGLLAVQRRVLLAIGKLSRDSVPITFAGAGAARAELWDESRFVAWRELRFRGKVAFQTEA